MWERGRRGGVEAPRDASEHIILCNLYQVEEVFGWLLCPEGGTVCEDGEDNGMVDCPPIGEVEPSDGVA